MSPPQLGEILDLLETGECPWESQPALMKILEGDDSKMKLRALEFTSDLIDKDAFALRHLDIVEDGSERTKVRARAAIALGPTIELCGYGFWDDPYDPPPLSRECFRQIQRRFERLYRSADVPKLVRRRALEASVRAPQEWHRGAIRAAWNGEDPEWRRTAVYAMGEVGGFESALSDALDADDKRIVCQALRAAANQDGVPGARKKILHFARTPQAPRGCRIAAIEALRFVSSPDAFSLLDRLTHDRDDEVAGTAAWALDEWTIYNGDRSSEF